MSEPKPQQPSQEYLSPTDTWGGVTNPENHDPSSFRYLVHGFNTAASDHFRILGLQDEINGTYEGHDYMAHGDQTVHLITEPERINDRVSLSMSLVDQDHKSTWGDGGLIVEASPDSIVLTSSIDAGAANSSVSMLRKQALNNLVVSGDTLMARTTPSSYNEVVAIAGSHPDMPDLELKGFFYQATYDGHPIDKALYDKLQAHSRRLGLPLVPLLQERRYPINIISIEGNEGERMAVHHDGVRYLLEGFADESNFTSITEDGRQRFVAPSEMQKVLDFMAVNQFEDKKIQELKEKYEEVDRDRHAAKIECDDEGNFKAIVKRRGYGAREESVWVGRAGYSSVSNIDQQIEAFKRMDLMSAGAIQTSSEPPPMLSAYEVEELVREAIDASGSEQERELVGAWFNERKADIQRHYDMQQERNRTLGGAVMYSLKDYPRLGGQDA